MKKFVILLLYFFAVNATAQTWQIGYPNPADVTAILANDTLTISGTGAMQDFEFFGGSYYYTTAPWFSIRESITALVINEGITNIGNYSFVYFAGDDIRLTGFLTIPNSVVRIGDYAFGGCIRLLSITIPNSVAYIGEAAFSGCESLPSVIIPNSVTYIGNGAFSMCNGLTSVIIPNSVTAINAYTFYDCENLTSINIPNSVVTIDENAFKNCVGLTSIFLHKCTPPTIYGSTFENVDKSIPVYIPCCSENLYQTTQYWNEFTNYQTFPPDTTMFNASICEGNTYTDENFTDLYTAGIYKDTLKNIFNCDSVIILNLSKNFPSDTTFFSEITCSSDLPYTTHGFNVSTEGRHYLNTTNTDGCDSVIALDLEVSECNISVAPFAEICADDEFFILNYSSTEKYVKYYSVIFNQKAIDAGFQNIVGGSVSDSEEIKIPIPQFPHPNYVRPDNYSLTLEFQLFNDSTEAYPLDFTILYPSWVMEQVWNDVIALLNAQNNGGYSFSAYEWHLDGVKIPNESRSFIYIQGGGTLEMGGEYRALLTRTGEDYGILTCPLIPDWHTDITPFPTVIDRGTQFMISSKTAVKLSIYSVSGIKLAGYQLIVNEVSTIPAPHAAGVYIFVLEDAQGNIQTEKAIVR